MLPYPCKQEVFLCWAAPPPPQTHTSVSAGGVLSAELTPLSPFLDQCAQASVSGAGLASTL